MTYLRRALGRFDFLPVVLCLLTLTSIFTPSLWAGGTPDPGTGVLVEDTGDADSLPDNENQLIGLLGSRRGFGFGDYVSDGIEGLNSTIAPNARYEFYIEVPPGQTSLVVEIFDADTGAGDVSGTEEHDQNDASAWDTITTYELIGADGFSVASITLGPQDCDPGTVGMQTTCNNTWSNLDTFSVVNPDAGHWMLAVSTPDGVGDRDDNNSFGIRAHDGDASASGTEYNVYANTYVGIGHVYPDSFAADPGMSRTYDFFPYVRGGCACDVNDWDSDDGNADQDESIFLAPQSPVTGATSSYLFDSLSDNGVWGQSQATGFSLNDDATAYGLWDLRFITGKFNFITLWLGDDGAADPVLPPTSPGNGAEPNQQPEFGSIRLYFPVDGSRFFGQRGGVDDVVASPVKPSVGHSWTVISGPDPIVAGATSRVRVTITIDNPTIWPIQFDTSTADTEVLRAHIPANMGQTTYVASSAAINNASAAAGSDISVTGTGPWDLVFAPGVVDAGTSATLTYDIDVTPSAIGLISITGGGSVNGTRGAYFDETCADGTGVSDGVCTEPAKVLAIQGFGPLCELSENVTMVGAAGISVTKTAGAVSDVGGGVFQTTYSVVVENTGTTNLSNVQVTDDLSAAFGAPATFSVTAGPSVGGTLTANGSYDGSGDTNLLVAGSSTLTPGAMQTITYTVQFDPNGLAGPFTNTANGSAEDPLMNMVNDSDTAMVSPAENPSIVVTKTLQGSVVDNGGGSFTATFQVSLENTGNVDLSNVQVVDDLTTTFGAPASLTSAGTPIATGTLTANGGYDGDTDTDLLNAGSSTLPVGATETVTFTATFDAGGSPGPFTNTANGSGDSPAGTTVQDNDTADVSLAENPAIAVIKALGGSVTDNMDGTFTADFQIDVSNTGDVDLSNVQVVDTLGPVFPPPASIITVTTPIATGTLTANPGYDGEGASDLLTAGSSTLAVAASGTITFSVTFDPGGSGGPFTNTATASGDSPLGSTVMDSDTEDVTVTPPVQQIGIAKSIDSVPTDNMDGTYTADLTFVVENLGNVDLTDVQVVDDLGLTFAAPASVVSVTAPMAMITSGTGALTANAAYDGTVDTNLLVAATSSLDIGALGEITVSVTFDPGGLTSFLNTATATADSVAGPTSDISDNGTEPDTDGDGNPDEDGENDPTPIFVPTQIDIPTAGTLGLLAMMLLLLGVALPLVRKS